MTKYLSILFPDKPVGNSKTSPPASLAGELCGLILSPFSNGRQRFSSVVNSPHRVVRCQSFVGGFVVFTKNKGRIHKSILA